MQPSPWLHPAVTNLCPQSLFPYRPGGSPSLYSTPPHCSGQVHDAASPGCYILRRNNMREREARVIPARGAQPVPLRPGRPEARFLPCAAARGLRLQGLRQEPRGASHHILLPCTFKPVRPSLLQQVFGEVFLGPSGLFTPPRGTRSLLQWVLQSPLLHCGLSAWPFF